jgi:hypothetical protein
MSELAAVIETASTLEWQRIRAKEQWIPNTEDERGAFVVGFARGTHFGIGIDLKKVAAELVGTASTQAERDVIAERRRQVEQEGWTAAHETTTRGARWRSQPRGTHSTRLAMPRMRS